MVRAFPAPADTVAPPVFGLSAVLRERIEHGEPADLLASADMDQPRTLARPIPPPLVPGRSAVQGIFLSDRADVMLGYCSSAGPVARELPNLSIVPLPSALTVGPAYGLIVLFDNPLAARLALFVLSEQEQAILPRHGFDPIGLAR
jgi:ABC-type molybdate transport system substrate-binding protein